MSIVERISKLAKQKNIPISQIERDLNFGNGTIRKWDTSSPACQKAMDLANYLEVDLLYLLTGKLTPKLSEEHQEILNIYNQLPTKQRNNIKNVLQDYKDIIKGNENQ